MDFNSLFNFILFFSISTGTPFFYREILSYLNLPFLHTLLIFVISLFLSIILNGAFSGIRQLFSFISGSSLAQAKNSKSNILNITKIPSSPTFSNYYQLIFLIIFLSVAYSISYSLVFLCYSISELDFTVICNLCFTQLFSTLFNFIFFRKKLPILGFLALLSIFSGLFTVLYNFHFLHRNFCYSCQATNINIPFQNHFGEKVFQILCQVLASFFTSLSNFLFAKTLIYINEKFFFPNDYNTMQYKSSYKFINTLNSLVHIIQFWITLISIIVISILYFILEFSSDIKIKFSFDYLTLLFFGVALNELKILSEIKLIESTGWHFSVNFSKLRILPVLLINLIILNRRFNKSIRLPIEESQLSFQFPLNMKKTYTIQQSIGTFFILVGTVFLSLTTDNNYSFITNLFGNNYRSNQSSDNSENEDVKIPSNSPPPKISNDLGMQINLNNQEDEFSSLLRIENPDLSDKDEKKK